MICVPSGPCYNLAVMPAQKLSPPILMALSTLLLASGACTLALGGPSIPPGSSAPTQEGLESFKEQWLDLPEKLTEGQFLLIFSEEEVASVVDDALVNGESAAALDISLHDIHVDLADNVILLYAQTNGGLVNASGVLALHPLVNDAGQLLFQVESAEFGRASFNDALLDRIAMIVGDSLVAPASSLPVSIVLTSVAVSDEQLILTGYIVE